jgi:hypothetical protein
MIATFFFGSRKLDLTFAARDILTNRLTLGLENGTRTESTHLLDRLSRSTSPQGGQAQKLHSS